MRNCVCECLCVWRGLSLALVSHSFCSRGLGACSCYSCRQAQWQSTIGDVLAPICFSYYLADKSLAWLWVIYLRKMFLTCLLREISQKVFVLQRYLLIYTMERVELVQFLPECCCNLTALFRLWSTVNAKCAFASLDVLRY